MIYTKQPLHRQRRNKYVSETLLFTPKTHFTFTAAGVTLSHKTTDKLSVPPGNRLTANATVRTALLRRLHAFLILSC